MVGGVDLRLKELAFRIANLTTLVMNLTWGSISITDLFFDVLIRDFFTDSTYMASSFFGSFFSKHRTLADLSYGAWGVGYNSLES